MPLPDQAVELRESFEERKLSAEEKRGQAALVTAWFAYGPLEFRRHEGGGWGWGATVRNASDLPVFDVRAAFHRVEEPVKGLRWTPMTCGTSLTAIRVLPPAAERRLEIPPDVASQYPTCNDTVYVVSVTFTDAVGNRWERDPRGALNPRS